VKKLTLIVNEFRKIGPDITANQMLVLLHAGAKPGIMQKELSAATDLADGTISRICALMSDRGHESQSMAPVYAAAEPLHFSHGQMIAARAWTAWKQAMWETGCKLPTQSSPGSGQHAPHAGHRFE
jgi:hypothetical protein